MQILLISEWRVCKLCLSDMKCNAPSFFRHWRSEWNRYGEIRRIHWN